MWYKIENDKIIVAPKNKKLKNGSLIINFNKNIELLQEDGYIEYKGQKTISELKIVDNQIVEKTEQDILLERQKATDQIWNGFYIQNPDLAVCVKQYKDLLDKLNLSYQAKTYDISTAITTNTQLSDIQKINLGFTATTLWNNIILNIESLNIKNPMTFAWENMKKLIEYLPSQQSINPEITDTETTELTE